ncbi:MAG: M23 family metallopeptidase [Candidatus Marinimicrobia bacterium]|nr:M23 family metallopeptidase [Candidatus Neomarinimicrobiota bacterium]
MKKYSTLLLIILFSSLMQAYDYLWPVDVSHNLSATFGEFRTGHFHSGIDIKTDQTIHHPVYTISDGYIWRIRETYNGYGKAIYVKMQDGNFSVYAHLNEFAPKIEKYIEQEQFKQGRFKINKYLQPNQFPVKKGDLIAYTGRSGTVHPHLHFEIRTADHKPFNALLTNLEKKDHTPPIIKSIALTPLSQNSRISYFPDTKLFPIFKTNGEYRLHSDTITVDNNFGIEIKTYDMVKGLYNKYGPYIIELFVDDSLAFSIQCDTLSFQNTHLIDYDRNSRLMTENKGRFIRLWKFLKDKKLPFYKGNHSGILNLDPGFHKIKILVKDFNTNISRLEFTVEQGNQPLPQIRQYLCNNDSTQIAIARDSTDYSYKNIKVYWYDENDDFKPADIRNFQISENFYNFTLDKSNQSSPALKLITTPKFCSEKQQIYLPCNTTKLKENQIDYRFIQNPGNFLIRFNFSQIPDSIPILYLHTPEKLKRINLISEKPDKYITAPVHYSLWEKALAMEIRLASRLTLRTRLNLTHLKPNKSSQIHSPDSLFSMQFNENSVARNVLVGVSKSDLDLEADSIVVSPVYKVTPQSLNLLEPGQVTFRYDTSLTNLSKIGIYTFYKDKFHYLDSDINFYNHSFTTSAKAGPFCLVEDTEAPQIDIISPKNNATYSNSRLNYITAKVTDELSGIKDDMSIALTLDNEDVIAEYNAANDYVRYKLAQLESGRHEYKITVTDKMGNTSSKKATFFIK